MNIQDRAFMITFSMILGALALFAVVIFFIAAAVSYSPYIDEERAALKLVDSNARLAPVGQVVLAGSEQAQAEAQMTSGAVEVASADLSGAEIYQTSCAACHAAGVMESPKLGDQGVWATRYEQGLETLVGHAINGLNTMPPKGGNTALSDDNVRAAVIYILSESGIPVADDAAPQASSEQQPAQAETEQAATEQTTTTEAATEQADADTAATAADAGLLPDGLDLAQGKEIYETACTVCHAQGIANAPKLGDQAGWNGRLEQGWDTLVDHAINGFKGMPPKGGRVDLSDEQIVNSVGYMVDQVQ